MSLMRFSSEHGAETASPKLMRLLGTSWLKNPTIPESPMVSERCETSGRETPAVISELQQPTGEK